MQALPLISNVFTFIKNIPLDCHYNVVGNEKPVFIFIIGKKSWGLSKLWILPKWIFKWITIEPSLLLLCTCLIGNLCRKPRSKSKLSTWKNPIYIKISYNLKQIHLCDSQTHRPKLTYAGHSREKYVLFTLYLHISSYYIGY